MKKWVQKIGLIGFIGIGLLLTIQSSSAAPEAPEPWPPGVVEIGAASGPGGADEVAAIGANYRYQYLSAGAGRSYNWTTWNTNGNFPLFYIRDSKDHGVTPVFTYYMICQATDQCYSQEIQAVKNNLSNTSLMRTYWNELGLFFEKAAEEPTQEIILHVEPDMWGFIHQDSSGNNAANYPRSVKVGSTGVAGISHLPDTPAGFAQALFALRDHKGASNVLIGYHISDWGSGTDFSASNSSTAEATQIGRDLATFYNSLNQDFDMSFTEIRDRDAGYYENVLNRPNAYWTSVDYNNHVTVLKTFNEMTDQPFMIWQVPLGNSSVPADRRDNIVETLLGDSNYTQLKAYGEAGVQAVLFGAGAGQQTTRENDNGYFDARTAAYYAAGPVNAGGFSASQTIILPKSIQIDWNDVDADSYEIWNSTSSSQNTSGSCASSSSCTSLSGSTFTYSYTLPGNTKRYIQVVPVTNGSKGEGSEVFVLVNFTESVFTSVIQK